MTSLQTLLSRARAKGTDSDYRAFIQRQPSAVSGVFSEYLESGEGRCVAAHFRTAANSGVGMKPDYSAIPLTCGEHDRQHRVGQYQFLPKAEWERLTRKYLLAWINTQEDL